jgi:glucokinase
MVSYAGIDLGATYLRAIVGDEVGNTIASHKRKTPQGPDGATVTEAVVESLRAACSEAGIDPTEIAAVGIGSIGPLDLDAGTVEDPANLPDTIDRIELTGPVRELTDAKAINLHNDTIAGVIGERFYSERSPDNMVYLTVSTGIGAGVCVDGHVLTGWDGNAGEVGHISIDPDGFMTCGCNKPGHWEAYCSGNNIPRYVKARYAAEGEPATAMDVESDDFSAKEVYDHAGEDEFADEIIETLNTYNAMGVANIVQSYAPSVIYIGGGVASNNPELVIDPIRERLPDRVMVNIPDIVETNLGDDVVLKGALASALTGGTGDRSKLD